MKKASKGAAKKGSATKKTARGIKELSGDIGMGPGLLTRAKIEARSRSKQEGPSETERKIAEAAGIDLDALQAQAIKNLKGLDSEVKRTMKGLLENHIKARKNRPPIVDMWGEPQALKRKSR